jgi:hypothetical protein
LAQVLAVMYLIGYAVVGEVPMMVWGHIESVFFGVENRINVVE